MSDTTGLTDEERAELEALRAEKAARERAARAQAERAELERLRAEKAAAEAEAVRPSEAAEAETAQPAPRPAARPAAAVPAQPPVTEAERAQLARDAAARERGRRLMEPDDDELKMAPGQKIVVAAILIVAIAWGIATFLG